jgi:hypothetical protein
MVVIGDLNAENNGQGVIYTDSQTGMSTPGKLVGWDNINLIVRMVSPIDNKEHNTRCWPEDVEFGNL